MYNLSPIYDCVYDCVLRLSTIVYKQKMLQSLMPRVVFQFMPRVAVAMQSIILLNMMAEKIPNGSSQVLTITVSSHVADDEFIVRPSTTHWSSFKAWTSTQRYNRDGFETMGDSQENQRRY